MGHIGDHLPSNLGFISGSGISCYQFITKLLFDSIFRGCFYSAGGTVHCLLGQDAR